MAENVMESNDIIAPIADAVCDGRLWDNTNKQWDKNIIKVIRSLENRGILLKATTRKIISQEGGLLNFIGPLMKVGLPLPKHVLIALAISVLTPLGLKAAASATNVDMQKNIYGSGMTTLIISSKKWKTSWK